MKNEVRDDPELAAAFEPERGRGHRGQPARQRPRPTLHRRAGRAVPARVRLARGVEPRVHLPDGPRADGPGPGAGPRLPGDRLRLPDGHRRDAARHRGRIGGDPGRAWRARRSRRCARPTRPTCGWRRSPRTTTSTSTRGPTPISGWCCSRSAASSSRRVAWTCPTTCCSCATPSCARSSAAPTPSTRAGSSRPAGRSARRPPGSSRATGSGPSRRRSWPSRTSSTGATRSASIARRPPTRTVIEGIAASAGVIEGTARVVRTVDEFDQVRDGDILVCQMTNPAWVVLFTKIAGLVTDTGGTTSHPAVLAREFGIPAVVGTSDATHRIATGDTIRVDGGAGRVDILARVGRPSPRARPSPPAPSGDERGSTARPARPRRPGQGAAARGHPERPARARTRGSSRRPSPRSSASARRRCARRCAAWRRSASSRSRRSAGRASGGRRDGRSSRPTPCGPRWRRWPPGPPCRA